MPSTPATPAAPRYTVSVLGFAGAERDNLAAFLRAASRGGPAFQQVDSLALADFVVADADQADAVREVLAAGRIGDTVFVGTRAPTGARAFVALPLVDGEPARSLERLAAGRRGPAARQTGTIDLLLADLGLSAPASAPAPDAMPGPAPASAPARQTHFHQSHSGPSSCTNSAGHAMSGWSRSIWAYFLRYPLMSRWFQSFRFDVSVPISKSGKSGS